MSPTLVHALVKAGGLGWRDFRMEMRRQGQGASFFCQGQSGREFQGPTDQTIGAGLLLQDFDCRVYIYLEK